jgi:N-acetylglucosaminyldiphosphoundecaprenol N-acetyl-beta-D-mannosaminyltransferase
MQDVETRMNGSSQPPDRVRVSVANIEFDNVTMSEAVQRIVAWADVPGGQALVCTGNLDHLVTLQQDAAFRAAYQEADLVLADGMPIVWISRLARGAGLKERVAGSDLFWELARVSHTSGLRLFFLGGSPGSAQRAADAVQHRYPQARVCGVYCPPFETFETRVEQERIRTIIRAARPDVLLVGLGAPKQEKWILAHRDRLGVPVSIGVGGSFEMAGGVISRAPRWMRRVGLEWVHRLLQEPGRMWKRYICRDLPLFLRLVIGALAVRRNPRVG